MHYVKIWSSILDGSLADDYRTRHVYEDLLKLADADGVVDMHPRAIAARLRLPLSMLTPALRKLSEPDPDSRTPGSEGRRISVLEGRTWGWRIVNWHLYRRMRSTEDVREQARIRQEKHRIKGCEAATPNADKGSEDVTRRHTLSRAVTPGSRYEVERKRPPLCPPTGGDLASLGRHPPEDPGVVVLIPVRSKPRSTEVRPEPIRAEVVANLEAEYRDVDVRGELVEIRRWSLREAQKPRRGKLWALAMPGIHNWLRRASRQARSCGARASPAANPRAEVDRAYREANARIPPEAGEGPEHDTDPITEHLAGRTG